MEDPSVEKIAISGPALASMIQRFSTSRSSIDGLIFGHVTLLAPTLTDDDSSTSSTLIATVTSFFCSSSSLSFYSPSGRPDPDLLARLAKSSSRLLGWFSGRRRSHIRPSLREFAVSAALASNPNPNLVSSPISGDGGDIKPCLFLLFASPIADQAIHTHEYRAYQFRSSMRRFDPKTIDVVNIGPAFRGHYGAFSPNSELPLLPCEPRVSAASAAAMNVDRGEEEAQSELDMCAEGLEVSGLSKLMGPEAAGYTCSVEELYEKMLVKIESLARQVETSSAKIHKQEEYNRKLRYKAARTSGL